MLWVRVERRYLVRFYHTTQQAKKYRVSKYCYKFVVSKTAQGKKEMDMKLQKIKEYLEDVMIDLAQPNFPIYTHEIFLKRYYCLVTRKEYKKQYCDNAIRVKLMEMYNTVHTKDFELDNRKYRFKMDKLLFHKGGNYTYATLTDEVAQAYLEDFPENQYIYFDAIPFIEDTKDMQPISDHKTKEKTKARLSNKPKTKATKIAKNKIIQYQSIDFEDISDILGEVTNKTKHRQKKKLEDSS